MDRSFTAPPPPLQGPFAPTTQDPSQVFGNYGQDTSSPTPALNFDFFPEHSRQFGFDAPTEDHGDPKRRRIAKACDACRRKKIKCDGQQPKCSHCQNYKTDCVFTHVEKKRNPPKSAKYIEGLENRLGRMENLLKMTGLLDASDLKGADLKTLEARLAQQGSPQLSNRSQRSPSYPQSRSKSAHGSPNHTDQMQSPDSGSSSSPRNAAEPREGVILELDQKKVDDQDVEALSDMMCSLVTNTCGDTKFFGSSSGFSIISPKGIQWVNKKTGDESFQKMISYAAKHNTDWALWRPDVFSDVFKKRGPTLLPPKKEAESLIREFFESFNLVFPLFHEPTFWWLLDKEYSANAYEGSGWYASLNVALAISYRIRVVKNLSPGDDDEKAWAHFRNCLAVHTELTLRNTDLLSVQALLGMSLFMQGTPNPQPGFSLLGAAIRSMHTIGLHKRTEGFGLTKMESEQRRRVFWIAYLIDKEMSLRSGRPPMQDDSDWNVELPGEEPEDSVGVVTTDDGEKVNLFRKLCEFGLISGKVYHRLYSVQGQRQSDGELLDTIGELDRELQEWKDSIPEDFRPEHEPQSRDQALMLQIVTVHFGYYNCLTTIHRMSVHHGYWSSRLSDFAINGRNVKPLNPRVYSSAALVVQAARASINLIKYIPQGDYACVWLVLYYPVSSLITLFANILQNPQDARARADLKLIGVVVSFLSRIIIEERTQSMRTMYTVTKEFERIANVVLNRAEREMNSRQKRKQEHESDKFVDDSQSRQPDALNTSRKRAVTTAQTTSAASSKTVSNGASDDSPLEPANSFAEESSSSAFPGMSGLAHNTDLDDAALRESLTGLDPTLLSTENASFQQPFVPQDLWSMPMTFEWDWAEMGRSTNDALEEASPNKRSRPDGSGLTFSGAQTRDS